jgi:hypothetical protein
LRKWLSDAVCRCRCTFAVMMWSLNSESPCMST